MLNLVSSIQSLIKDATHKDVKTSMLAKDEIAKMLKTNPEALEAFEQAYETLPVEDHGIYGMNAKEAAGTHDHSNDVDEEMVHRIVTELLSETEVYKYDGEAATSFAYPAAVTKRVEKEELMKYDVSLRPQLTGTMMCKDCGQIPASNEILWFIHEFMEGKTEKKRQQAYHMFRAGLDILDLDPIMYEIIGMNQNSIGHWLPPIVEAVKKQDYFKVPKTTVIKVPLPLLQMTRLEYETLTPMTIRIANEYCHTIFDLDDSTEYFIRTGTHSSKYDFRNAHVTGAKEVQEIGEYLLFIHFQGLSYAHMTNAHPAYGAATTNEWVVREYIQDKEKNPTIYHGLPLRTEMRAFVDFDEKKVIGIAPYWDPDTMKKRFATLEDRNEPDMIHDYTIYRMHEDTLMARFNKYKDTVEKHLQKMLDEGVQLHGQWSVDIMLNGEDGHEDNEVYIIDMALAQYSALKEYMTEPLKKVKETWIPKISDANAPGKVEA